MNVTANDLRSVTWRKSSHSNGTGGNCVEVADGIAGVVPVRDSKVAPRGPVLCFSAEQWGRFVSAVRAGRFNG
ncbi:DUF397 domain-containing protein [Streptomyces sp. NPDC048172]|uniref:DUF397 domain-containing protein n=1 Tax=Streptomyces sp. NPDC048172 TaxID=3365505 RepID=UPI00370FC37F